MLTPVQRKWILVLRQTLREGLYIRALGVRARLHVRQRIKLRQDHPAEMTF